MLEKLSIQNFKAFSGWQDIVLAPITLIYGPNSSGKSSIIHSIMLLKQSLTRPNLQGGLVSNGEFVDLGDFSSMVHGHDLARDISFRFTYMPTKKQSYADFGFDVFGRSTRREYELTYKYHLIDDAEKKANVTEIEKKRGFSYLHSMGAIVRAGEKKEVLFSTSIISELPKASALDDIRRLGLPDEKSQVADKATIESELAVRKKKSARLVAAAKKFRFFDKNAWESVHTYLSNHKIRKHQSNKAEIGRLLDGITFKSDINYATPSAVEFDSKVQKDFDFDSHFQLNMAFSSLARDLKEKFTSISYLGPLRSHPSRFYAPKTDQNDSVGKQGENVAKFIYERPEITDDINAWFSQFEVPYKLSSDGIGNDVSGPVICLQLEDKRTGVMVGPSDVGFGIGQMLPIIVEGLVRDDSVICVEQPEIHLHPRLQAHLANFFVSTCKTNQWIVETHSESLMIRLQNLIAGKKIKPTEVAVIYVEPTDDGGQIIPIRIDKDGDFIDAWPEGFFEERLKEKMGLSNGWENSQ
jgi:predicted ATPase